VFATASLVALLAIFPLVWSYVSTFLPRNWFGQIVGLPAAWVLLEWVRTWAFTGFPWLLAGYSQTDTRLAGIAEVAGVLGVSWVTAIMAAAVAWAATEPSSRSRAAIALALVAGGLMLGVLVDRQWTVPSSGSKDVVVVQGNTPQNEKWDPAQRASILAIYRELTAANLGAPLIVWPETAVPTWLDEARAYLADLAKLAHTQGTSIVLGVPVRSAEGKAYNAVAVAGSEQQYYKRHLVPFGEYIPWRNTFGNALDVLGAPMSDFSPGVQPVLLSAAGLSIGAFVCYEAAFGAEVRPLAAKAEILLNLSNDGWFGKSIGPHQHFQMVRMRAKEAGRDVVRATNTGISAVIDHEGRVRAMAEQFQTTTLRSQVVPRTGSTPYTRWGDAPLLVLCSAALLATLLLRRGPHAAI
jgi:apolipoprotein N-acyltransferase